MEPEQSIQVLNEVANISQRLDVLQMMFFITIIVIFAGALVFAAFWRFASSNANADDRHFTDLIKALNELPRSFQEVANNIQVNQKTYWQQNDQRYEKLYEVSRKELAILNHIYRGFKQIIAILEVSNLIDTKEMARIKDEDLNI